MKPKAYKCDLCGTTAIDHTQLGCDYNRQTKCTCKNLSGGYLIEHVNCPEHGAQEPKSNQIEKLDTYWGYDIEEIGDKINEIIDYLQKG